MLKIYVKQLLRISKDMLKKLDKELAEEKSPVVKSTVQTSVDIEKSIALLKEELKMTKRQRIRDVLKHPDQEEIIQQTYDELELEIQNKLEGVKNQLSMVSSKKDTIEETKSVSKTAIGVFESILRKKTLTKQDIGAIAQKIVVYDNRIEVFLHSDINELLMLGQSSPKDDGDILEFQLVQSSANTKDKLFNVNVVYNGEPPSIPIPMTIPPKKTSLRSSNTI